MKKYAIIAAGGSGVRMGNAIPKQFLLLRGKPILWYSVKAFVDAIADIQIIVVAPAAHLEEAKRICATFNDVCFVEGGDSRFQSVKNGLAMVQNESIVFVHDAVRCLITTTLIMRCYEVAIEKGSAVPSVAVNDSIRIIDGERNKIVDRNLVRIIQTPQTFSSDIVLPSFNVGYNDRFTDEATVVEYSGKTITLVEGEHTNIKITRPLDVLIAEQILEERSSS